MGSTWDFRVIDRYQYLISFCYLYLRVLHQCWARLTCMQIVVRVSTNKMFSIIVNGLHRSTPVTCDADYRYKVFTFKYHAGLVNASRSI